MGSIEMKVWGIHGGRFGNADNLFIKNNCVAVGWHQVGNLSEIKSDREAFKDAIIRTYPDKKEGAVPNNAGQLFRFVYEMKTGDYVVYPSKKDRHVHIGTVTGEYEYDTKGDFEYPNRRTVKWIKTVPRTHFTQGALFEIGSAITFFQVKNYADEFIDALEDKAPVIVADGDSSIAPIAENIEEGTRDFILKTLATELKGHPFTDFIAHLMNTMGYRTKVAAEGPDGGVDILAHKDELGFEPPIIKVQVKSIEGSVGDPVVSALYGKVSTGEYGLLVTLGTFTNHARQFAGSKSNLRLIDGSDLVELIMQHYEQFDSRYKALIPLKRVYIPQPIEE